jgi:hypothetical protein
MCGAANRMHCCKKKSTADCQSSDNRPWFMICHPIWFHFKILPVAGCLFHFLRRHALFRLNKVGQYFDIYLFDIKSKHKQLFCESEPKSNSLIEDLLLRAAPALVARGCLVLSEKYINMKGGSI